MLLFFRTELLLLVFSSLCQGRHCSQNLISCSKFYRQWLWAVSFTDIFNFVHWKSKKWSRVKSTERDRYMCSCKLQLPLKCWAHFKQSFGKKMKEHTSSYEKQTNKPEKLKKKSCIKCLGISHVQILKSNWINTSELYVFSNWWEVECH